MIISHKINQHLDRMEEHLVEAVQGDSGRELAMHLYYQNATWTPPEGTKAVIRYASSDGTGGCYDTMPDGAIAWNISGSVLSVRLAPRVLGTPGITRLQVLLSNGSDAIATFSVLIRVQADPTAEGMEAEDYVNLTRWIGEEVAKQVTDAVAPPAVVVVGISECCADCEFSDIEDAWNENQGICCRYKDTILWLQGMVEGECFTFSGIRGEEIITITLNREGQVGIDHKPLAEDNQGLCIHGTRRPAFAWIDDDGKEKVGHLFQWAKTNQVPFTCALIAGWIARGEKGWLTVDQLKTLRDSGLVSFASHTQNHVKLTDADRATVEAELKNSKEQIESWGLSCVGVVYPNGAVRDEDIDLVHQYYPFGFAAGGTYNADNLPIGDRVNISPVSTYRLMRVDIRGDYTEENGGLPYLRSQVDNAIANNGLLVFMSHIGSTGNGAGGYLNPSDDLAVYSYVVNYIRERGYDITPLMDAWLQFANPMEVEDCMVGVDGTVAVTKGNLHTVAPYNAYTIATLPSQYPKNQIITCRIYDSSAPGSTSGILTAYVTDTLAYRTFMPQNGANLYLQIKSNTEDMWIDWTKCNQKDFTQLSNNKILSTTLPSALPKGVSICVVASSGDTPNLPEGVMGMMTVYNLFSGADKAREEWQPNGSICKYIRYAVNANEWSPWYVLTPTLYQT